MSGRYIEPADWDQVVDLTGVRNVTPGAVLERAWAIYRKTRSEYRHRPPPYVENDAGLARPFGRPSEMPEHVWRVSQSNWEALMMAVATDGMYIIPTASDLLFGFPIEVADTAEGDLLELVAQ